jgi:signal transduction histidine kinase/DNA-binding response OmpR family regulator
MMSARSDERLVGNILIVGDDTRGLEPIGARVVRVASAAEALQVAKAIDFTLVVLAAPEEDAEALRSRMRVPVIAVARDRGELVWTTDAAGRLTSKSSRWDELFGGRIPENSVLAAIVHPHDRDLHLNGREWDGELRLGTPNRGWRYHRVRITPRRDTHGTVIGWLGTAKDVDAQARADRALRMLADASLRLNRSVVVDAYTGAGKEEAVPSTRGPSSSLPRSELEGVLRTALPLLGDGAILDLIGEESQAIERLRVVRRGLSSDRLDDPRFDLASATVVYRGRAEVFLDVTKESGPPSSDRGLGAAQMRFLAELGVTGYICVPLTTRDTRLGTLSFVKLTQGDRFEESDVAVASDLARRIAISIDNARLHATTERRRLELEEANKSKDVFLATLSHELRTPLNAIVGWIEMMKKGGALDASEQARALDTIDRNARALTGLVADLLDVSRIVTGTLKIESKPVSLPAIVDAAVLAARPQLENKQIELVRAPDGEVGIVLGDPGRLRQIVANLLSNAIKFTPSGGRVRVSVRELGGYVRLVVADNGKGIAPDFLPHVFERFRQEQTGRSKGLGLGLAIVKHLVQEHGGTVSAASDGHDHGATFTIDLPVAHAVDSESERAALSVQPPSDPQLDGVNVLIVEDDPDGNELLSTILEEYGARVTSATTAGGALDALDVEQPAVLISDIGLPDMDGMELIRTVRSRSQLRSIPAIALTAYASRDDANKVVAAGFNAHVPKPVEPRKLAAMVLRLIRANR